MNSILDKIKPIISLYHISKKFMIRVFLTDHPTTDITITFPREDGTLLTVDELDTTILTTAEIASNNILAIVKPAITFPVNGATGFYGTVIATPYQYNGNFIGEHTGTDWEFSTVADFSVKETAIKNDMINLTSYPIDPNLTDTLYYARVRYRSGTIVSQYSDVISFTTPSGYAVKPTISVKNDRFKTSLLPNLALTDLKIIGDNDTITKVDWEVSANLNFTDIKFSSYNDTVNLTGITVSSGVAVGNTYFARARQYGDKYETSWSEPTSFTAGTQTTDPILVGDTEAYERGTLTVTISNYDSNCSYTITNNGGSVTRSDDVLTWVLPGVVTDQDYFLSVTAKDLLGGLPVSNSVKHTVTVMNIATGYDQMLSYNPTTIPLSFKDTSLNLVNGVSENRPFNLHDKSIASRVDKIAINNYYYTPVVGDKLYTDTAEEFEVKSFTANVTVDLTNVISGACGSDYTMLLKSNGDLYAAGSNMYGQLGLPDTIAGVEYFTLVTTGVKQVSAGLYHTVIVKNDGKVYVTGRNNFGQLGLGDNVDRHGFTELSIGSLLTVFAFDNQIAVLRTTGTVATCGYNMGGECGVGDLSNKMALTETNLTGITFIVVTGSGIACLDAAGNGYVTGLNTQGMLGTGNTTPTTTFIKTSTTGLLNLSIGYTHGLFVKADGTVVVVGSNTYGQIGQGVLPSSSALLTLPITNIKKAFAPRWSSLLLANDGSVYAAGFNNFGQTGLEVTTANITAFTLTGYKASDIIAGPNHTLVIKADGSILLFGLNASNQLGFKSRDINKIYINTPSLYYPDMYVTPVTNLGHVPIGVHRKDVTIIAEPVVQNTGDSDFSAVNDCVISESTRNVIDSTLQSTANKLYINNQYVDLKLGQQLITENNEIITIGNIGSDGSDTAISGIKSIIGATSGVFAIKENSELWYIGLNIYGEAGVGHNSNLTEWAYCGIKVSSIATGKGFTLAIRDTDGMVLSAGINVYGQLGLGTVTDTNIWKESNFYATRVAAGNNHALALDLQGLLYAVGLNNHGQLGINSSTILNKTVWTACVLPPTVYTVAARIYCGGDSSYVIRTDSVLYSAGRNDYGQLGINTTTDALSFTNTSVSALDMAAGDYHIVVIKVNNKLFGCGLNDKGQLGIGVVGNKSVLVDLGLTASKVFCNANGSYIRKLDGTWAYSGINTYGQSGNGLTANIFTWYTPVIVPKYIACMGLSTMVITEDGLFYATGNNDAGQFGKPEIDVTLTWVKLSVTKPFLGMCKTGYWIAPKVTIARIPQAVYPISRVSFNGVVASAKEGTYNTPNVTVILEDTEFSNSRTLTTSVDIPYTNRVYKILGTVSKIS